MRVNHKRSLRILYLTQHTHPDPGAPATRSFDLSRFWTEAGHRITVLAAGQSTAAGQNNNGFDRVRVVRCPVRPVDPAHTSDIIRFQAGFALKAAVMAVQVCRRWRPDVVLASVPALSVLVPALAAVSVSGASLVVEVRDIWPEELIAFGFPSSGPLPALVDSLLQAAYRRADRVVTVTEGFKTRLLQKGIPFRKLSVVPHGADLQTFKPLPSENWFRRDHGWDNDIFIALYAGNMGRAQGVADLVEAARFLPESIRLVLVGRGNQRRCVEQAVKWNSFGNIVLLSNQPRTVMPWVYAAADVCLVPLRQTSVLADAVPSKLAEIMACGRPVIASLAGAAADLVGQSGAGMAVPPGDPETLARAVIDTARKSRDELKAMGQSARVFAEQNFDRRLHANEYLKILTRVCHE
ncbi:MAG: glycosyltransferase family 4 protein [Gemmatimonadota bacterium]|nr:glycosyltransferase family 4 protein [Gemmatimonadota bacterium]